jgi:dTMP kinase
LSGHLITIEGIGGSGKTTLVSSISKWLEARAITHVVTREPGGTVTGNSIRELVLDASNALGPWVEVLLFEADRAETYSKVIGPALRAGKVVVSDRNFYGTIAYQGFGRGLDVAEIDRISTIAMGGAYPDLIVVLDLDPQVAWQRLSQVRKGDRFDLEGLAFQHRVREGFLYAAQRDSDRAVVLDATQDASIIASRTITAISRVLAADHSPH